ncbi:3-oxoacyl-[acyl-carrier protein] reductase [Agrilactobacillus composti DSM 18527 = JCM 14202]|nr:3-oxoacyl-[acyl-carrier protein] reductase [Agrilactobacillus composti DSM 18527 = JCM 14202]
MNLTDKVVFVTGSSRGIGKAIALAFAAKGAQVVLNSRHDIAPETLAEFADFNHEVGTAIGDISDPKDGQTLVKAIKAQYGSLDVLVNNAGITDDQLLLRMGQMIL